MTRAILGLALPLALMAMGCSEETQGEPSSAGPPGGAVRSGPSASASAGPDASLKFAECMRENGMAWYPSPSEEVGAQDADVPFYVSDEDFETAQAACRQFMPGLKKVGTADAAEVERLQQLVGCMRSHGVPGFPDPSADGSLLLDEAELGVKTSSAVFRNAGKACAQYRPKS
jgi:hypothetical protein